MRSGAQDGAIDSSNDETTFWNLSRKRQVSYPIWPGTETAPVPIRKALLTQFPYLVAFELHTDSVLVLAVAHAKRQPLYWLARTSQRPG
jgi:hypothetical protein